jgi:Flp pilus assembly protein TadD
MDASYGDAHYALGLLLAREGRPDEALTCFEKAIEIEPQDADILNSLGLALAQTGRLDEAIDRHKEALKIDPHHPWAHFSLGMAYLMKGDTRKAREVYRNLRTINPRLARQLGANINAAKKRQSRNAKRKKDEKE